MADEQNRVWVATHSFRTSSGDEIVAGETQVFGDDPVVQAHPDRFEWAANREARRGRARRSGGAASRRPGEATTR